MGKQSAIWVPVLNETKKTDEQSVQTMGVSKSEQRLLDAAFGPPVAPGAQSIAVDSDNKKGT